MYLDFYGFREKPFNLTPDPRFVFLSKSHKEAFAHLLYGLDHRAGFIALTGEVGSGKTTVLRTLLTQLSPDQYRTALIFNPRLSPPQLLQTINREFGLPTQTSNPARLLHDLNEFLLQQNAEGRTSVLVIDEVQNLEPEVLEQIRLISNLETDREKLIQIVLSGQPEFIQVLRRRDMRQLSQRITVNYHLLPMDFNDTVDYIHRRLEVAGAKGGASFSRWALRRIYRYSRGLPRLVNAACDRALLAGYTRDTDRIDYWVAAAGIRDLGASREPHPRKRIPFLILAVAALGTLLAAGLYLAGQGPGARSDPPQGAGAAEGAAKKFPIRTGERPSPGLAAELGGISESQSARRAFNTLASFWKVSPLPEKADLNPFGGMEDAARDRGLRLYRFSGNLGALLRMGSPAALELTLPAIPGKRFLTLVGMEGGELLTDPPIAGSDRLPFSDLEEHWSGRGFLLWKDPLDLPATLSAGARGRPVERLQDLLRESGVYRGSLTGVFDRQTLSAVREFQASKGIEEDGILGNQTLMLLYRSIDRFQVPKLREGKK